MLLGNSTANVLLDKDDLSGDEYTKLSWKCNSMVKLNHLPTLLLDEDDPPAANKNLSKLSHMYIHLGQLEQLPTLLDEDNASGDEEKLVKIVPEMNPLGPGWWQKWQDALKKIRERLAQPLCIGWTMHVAQKRMGKCW